MAFNDPGTLIPTKNKKKTSPAGPTYSTPKWNEARGGSVISLLDPSQRKPVKRPTIAQYDGYKAPVAPYQQAARLEWERPTSYNYMKNVDMFTSRNRYASVYSLLDNPNSFKFTPKQILETEEAYPGLWNNISIVLWQRRLIGEQIPAE